MVEGQLDIVRNWVGDSSRIVALTGAGISTESGIPDFRGPQGVWTQEPQGREALEHPLLHVRSRGPQAGLEEPARSSRLDAQPNAGHRALVELERRGKLHALITQNIDGLHQKAGNSPDKVIEVHGTMREVDVHGAAAGAARCSRSSTACAPAKTIRRATQCGGILKSATISFGQPLVPEVIDRAMRAAEQADLLLAIGTSLQVYPVAGAVPVAKAAGARVVIVNAEPTPFDEMADAVLRQPIGEILPALCGSPTS